MQLRQLVRTGAIAMLATAALGCGAGSSPVSPSGKPAGSRGVVLVTVDSLRPQELAIYGGASPTPGLARLAEGAVVYDDVRTVAPLSRAAVATILTGICPDRSGVRDDLLDRLRDEPPVLAERFREAGRTTAAFVTTPFVSYQSGLERGFDVFDGPTDEVFGPARRFPPARPSSQAADHFAEWLVTLEKGKSFFAWVHLAELHGLSAEPEADDARKAYAAGLGNVDAAVARILDALDAQGHLEETEIVLVGTHGELLGEGGLWGSSFWLTPETIRVPLIRRSAQPKGGKKTVTHDARRAWLPDVARTLAAEIGASLDATAEGVDLRDAAAPAGRIRYAWTWAPDDETAWPTVTAVDSKDGLAAFEWPDARAGERPATPREHVLPDESRAKIAKAGIRLGSGTPPPIPAKTVRDEALMNLARLDRAFALNRYPRIHARMALLLQATPDSLGVLLGATFRATRADDVPNSRRYASRLLELYPARQEALHWAAHADLLERKPARAEVLLEAAQAAGPPDPDVLYDLACTRSLAGDAAGGLRYLSQSIDLGYRDFEWIERDTDLTAVRADRGFADLMRRHGR